MDTEKEKRMGLGRSYSYPPLSKGETVLDSRLADSFSISVGDTIVLG